MRTVPLGWVPRRGRRKDRRWFSARFHEDSVASLLRHTQPHPVTHGQRFADTAVREHATRDIVLEF